MPFRLKVDAEEQSSAMGFVFTQNLNLQNLQSGIGLDFTEDNGNSINLPVAKTQFTANWSVSFDNANTDYLIAWTTNPLYVTYGLPIPPLSSNNSNVATVTRMDYVCNAASNLSDPSSIIQRIGPVATLGPRFNAHQSINGSILLGNLLSSAWAAMGTAANPLGGPGGDCISLATLMQYQLDMLGVRGGSPHEVVPRHAAWNGIVDGSFETNGLSQLLYWAGSYTTPDLGNNFEGCCFINGYWWRGGYGNAYFTPVDVLYSVSLPNDTVYQPHQCWDIDNTSVVPYPTASSPLSVVTVSCGPESVQGGSSATGTAILSANAPAGGVVLSLTTSDAFASAPSHVFVEGGSNSASFTINTLAVSARDTVIIQATGTDPTTGYTSWTQGRLTVTP